MSEPAPDESRAGGESPFSRALAGVTAIPTGHEYFSVNYNQQYPREEQPASIFMQGQANQSQDQSRGSMSMWMQSTPNSSACLRDAAKSPNDKRASIDSNASNDHQQERDGLAWTASTSARGDRASLIGSAIGTSPITPANTPNKPRGKAVITLDSSTLKILIANNKVSQMFHLRRQGELIGRKLTDVFSRGSRAPAIVEEITNDSGMLKAIYGRAIEIIDADGVHSTVCIWSYPLWSPTEGTSLKGLARSDRRYSMILRAPSMGGAFGTQMQQNPGDLASATVFNPTCSSALRCASSCSPTGARSARSNTSSPFPPTSCPPARINSRRSSAHAGACSRLPLEKIEQDRVMGDDHESDVKAQTSKDDGEQGDKQMQVESKKDDRDRRFSHLSRRWLILMEPVHTLTIACTLGPKGRIFRVDDTMATLLGYVSMCELLGTELTAIVPAVNLADDDRDQHVCAHGLSGNSIPMMLRVHADRDPQNGSALMYDVAIRCLSAVNGVVMLDNEGRLQSYNENFMQALTGRDPNASVVHMSVTEMIPDFYEYVNVDEVEDTALSNENCEGPAFVIEDLSTQRLSLSDDLANLGIVDPGDDDGSSLHESVEQLLGTTPMASREDLTTSEQTRLTRESRTERMIRESTFYGLARHIDGSLIAIRGELRRLDLAGGQQLWALCLGYDLSNDYGLFGPRAVAVAASASDDTSIDDDVGIHFVEAGDVRVPLEDENNEAVCGEYSNYYDTFQLIGNGAFGSVKLSARKSNGLLAVTKFICKKKVLPECWIASPRRGGSMVPIELHLLETLQHANIVKVLDVFENETFYQLVMEKLGCGMDLFEFIDNQPRMDEPLISHIFRQIVSAVAYLHAGGIVHRDLKDENVIIDQHFNCALIDFGSAAYFGRDILFSTFCGTMEYCSPEVLTGNKYAGPELEMWSLGILLFTLVFFENPFRTPQETVRAEIDLPWDVSEGLYQVISWLLQPDPTLRATVTDIQNHWWTNQPVDIRRYNFQEMLKNCERAQLEPPQYVSQLAHHLKNTSTCSVISSTAVTISVPKVCDVSTVPPAR